MTATKHTNNTTSSSSSADQPLLSDPQPPQFVIVLPPYPHPYRHRFLRKSTRRCLTFSAITLILLVAASYLLFPSDPDVSIVRLRLDNLHVRTRPVVSLDVVLDLTVKIRNRDFFSVDYDSLNVAIAYRGKRLGVATSGGGHIKARGSSYVNATLRLDGVEILSDAILLVEDLAKGAIPFDTVSEISGKIGFFLFDLPIKAKISCEVIVNTHNQTIARQSCYPEVAEVR